MKLISRHLALTVLVLTTLTPAGGLAQDVLDEPGFEGAAKYILMSIEDAQRLAEQGDVLAQAELFLRYRVGMRTADGSSDLDKALYWGRKAARQGHVDTQTALANALATIGTRREAARWWRAAAEQGDAYGQESLALAYFEGTGAPRDRVLAYQWCLLAAQALMKMPESLRWEELDEAAWRMIVMSRLKPLQSVTEMRGILDGSMEAAEVERAARLAREWKPKTWEELQEQE